MLSILGTAMNDYEQRLNYLIARSAVTDSILDALIASHPDPDSFLHNFRIAAASVHNANLRLHSEHGKRVETELMGEMMMEWQEKVETFFGRPDAK